MTASSTSIRVPHDQREHAELADYRWERRTAMLHGFSMRAAAAAFTVIGDAALIYLVPLNGWMIPGVCEGVPIAPKHQYCPGIETRAQSRSTVADDRACPVKAVPLRYAAYHDLGVGARRGLHAAG
jgi:hypothetical protein